MKEKIDFCYENNSLQWLVNGCTISNQLENTSIDIRHMMDFQLR